MISFHQELANRIEPADLKLLGSQCYVFPTKRGGLFFKRALIDRFGKQNFMLPAIFSIEDFVQKLTGLTITDELTLLFHLFKIYQKKQPELQFDDFYAWGKIILKDYDEIDRYMADAKRIYMDLQNIKELDLEFGITEEYRSIIERYRTLTERKEKTDLLTKFLEIWKEVGAVYEVYQEELIREEKAYGGMLYRNLANLLSQETIDHEFEYYHFCGFNALSKAEEIIFDSLVKAEKAQLYWDSDGYYMLDPNEEAGDFLRAYTGKWPESIVFDSNSLTKQKEVFIHGVPQQMAQSQLGADLVTQLLNDGAKPEETAIVLADEKLLIPLLYAMPLHDRKVNVTMGYPMRVTVVFDFVLAYLELIRKAKKDGKDKVFYAYDLKPFLSNAYASVFDDEIFQRVNDWLVKFKRRNISLEELKSLTNHSAIISLLESGDAWTDIQDRLKKYLTLVFYEFRENNRSQTDQEFIYFFIKTLNQLNSYLEDRDDFSLKLIKKIVQEYFRSIKIPFEGEPVQGVQIMGFLESRTLDFKQIIVLSANEGKLPTARNLNSYIPYGLRRVFELPTFEEQDAIYAYHFKRLIQRADKVHFVYDHSIHGDSTGEKSRFILQQQYLYQEHPNIRVSVDTYGSLIPEVNTDFSISLQKSPKVQDLLKHFEFKEGDASNYLSPTSLTNYITCPLKFYFQHVAGIRELEDVEEDIDARNLGIVVHEVLEYLYTPWLGKEVSSEQVKLLKGLVEKELEDSLRRNAIIQDRQQLTGRDLVTKEVMIQLVQKVLDLDMKDAPFTIEGLERKDYEKFVSVGDYKVRISGTIDRVDSKDGIIRITDYKTGKVELVSRGRPAKSDEEMTEELFVEPKYKSGFQGMLYAALMNPHYQEPIKVGITSLVALNDGTKWLNSGKPLNDQSIAFYEHLLDDMVKEIFNVNVPFNQTDDVARCSYCEFKKVCKRV